METTPVKGKAFFPDPLDNSPLDNNTVTERAMETLTNWNGTFVVFDDNKNIYRECILVKKAVGTINHKDFLYLVRFSDFEERWVDMSQAYKIDQGFDSAYHNNYGNV